MKKIDEETKKKRKQGLIKVFLIIVILGISIALSNVNLAQMGSNFFMKFFSFGLDQEEVQPAVTLEPEDSSAPSEEPSDEPEDTAKSSEESIGAFHHVSVYFI